MPREFHHVMALGQPEIISIINRQKLANNYKLEPITLMQRPIIPFILSINYQKQKQNIPIIYS